MKRINFIGLVIAIFLFTSCNENEGSNTTVTKKDENVLQKADTLAMSKDTLNARIMSDIQDEILERKVDIAAEALSVIAETRTLVRLIDAGDTQQAIDEGHKLIGKLEVLLTKDPSLALLPVDATYRAEDVVTDLETVKEVVKAAEEAMDDEYYQAARNLLEDLKSEIVISSVYIPTGTYPDAIKIAVALLEDGKKDAAVAVLRQVLTSVVIEDTVLPLPVLRAEQMVLEAASIDSVNHENADDVLNLLENANYQLKLAEAMGYGKKDKEYKDLYVAIKDLRKSVKEKADSKEGFDSLKVNLRKFKERLFPIGK